MTVAAKNEIKMITNIMLSFIFGWLLKFCNMVISFSMYEF